MKQRVLIHQHLQKTWFLSLNSDVDTLHIVKLKTVLARFNNWNTDVDKLYISKSKTFLVGMTKTLAGCADNDIVKKHYSID